MPSVAKPYRFRNGNVALLQIAKGGLVVNFSSCTANREPTSPISIFPNSRL